MTQAGSDFTDIRYWLANGDSPEHAASMARHFAKTHREFVPLSGLEKWESHWRQRAPAFYRGGGKR